jgi:hypothetical protein
VTEMSVFGHAVMLSETTHYSRGRSEVDARFVLTCQSFPVSEELTVDYDA